MLTCSVTDENRRRSCPLLAAQRLLGTFRNPGVHIITEGSKTIHVQNQNELIFHSCDYAPPSPVTIDLIDGAGRTPRSSLASPILPTTLRENELRKSSIGLDSAAGFA